MSPDVRQAAADIRHTAPASAASRVLIGSYTNYADAQRAVDYLSDHDFPVARLAIVAEGLKFVEQVTGRLGWGKAIINGAVGGAVTGMFVTLLFSFFAVFDPAYPFWRAMIWGLGIGGVIGAVFGALGYAMSGGRRDFTSVGGMQAERYDVVGDAEVAEKAREMLTGLTR